MFNSCVEGVLYRSGKFWVEGVPKAPVARLSIGLTIPIAGILRITCRQGLEVVFTTAGGRVEFWRGLISGHMSRVMG